MDNFVKQIEGVKEEIEQLEDINTKDQIEDVAVRLERLGYSPPIITEIKRFIRFDRNGLRSEVDRILAMSDAEACALTPGSSVTCEDLRVQYLTVLIYYYKKLLALRSGDAEEWDEVDELYVHD